MTTTLDRRPEFHGKSRLNRFYPLFDRTDDPLGFEADDANLYRYVGNSPTNLTDPSGLSPWSGIGKILGKKWTRETCERAGKRLATELLAKLKGHHPNSQKAQEIIRQLKVMGWVETTLGYGSRAGRTLAEGGGLILREVVDGKTTDTFLQWHPGGGHHGPEPYWKFSNGRSGTLWSFDVAVGAIAIGMIPGAAQASEGDWSGAGRDVCVEVSMPWAKALWESLGAFFNACERQLYGDEYFREMEEYRKDYWDKRK